MMHSFKGILRKLIETDTSNGKEGRILEILESPHIQILDLIEVDKGRYNVIMGSKYTELEKSILAFSGHIDTVPPKNNLKLKEDNKYFYGLGTSDMKGAIASYIYLMENFPELFENKVVILTVGEETDLKGIETLSKVINKKLPNLKYCIIGEPTDLKVGIGEKGIFELEIIVKGKSSHASIPEHGINAIKRALYVILNLLKLQNSKNTLEITKIEGGTEINTIPSLCKLWIDSRYLDYNFPDKIIRTLIDKDCSYNTILKLDPIKYSNFLKGVINAKEFFCPFRTEGVFYKNVGINPIIYGPGDIKYAHKPDERIEKSKLEKYINNLKIILKAF